MANIYVSQSATNGYIVGADTNDGSDKQHAVLTPAKALTLAAIGDTIIINDGVYAAPASPGYWDLNKTLTINPENAGQATLKGDGAYTSRLFNVQAASAFTVTMGGLILDGVDVNQVGIYCNQTNNLATLVFNGTDFRNFVYTPIKNSHASGYMMVTINKGKMSGTNWQRGGVHMPNITHGGLVVNGLTVNQSGRINAEGAVVFFHAIGPGTLASVKRVIGDSNLGATAVAATHGGVLLQNVPDAVIEYCDLNISGVGAGSAAATLYEISANATGVQNCSNGRIRKCNGANRTAAGKTAVIGSDVYNAVTNNQCNYGIISECELNGSSISSSIHGPMLGYNTGGKLVGNTTDYCGIGGLGLLKAMVVGTGPLAVPMAVGNKAKHCATSACYQKGSVGAIHANNTLITSQGYAPTFEFAAYDNSTTPNIMNTNGKFANNLITGDTAPARLGVQGTLANATDTSSGTVFYGSFYDESLGPLTNKWINGAATTYQNLADFNAAMADANYPCVADALNLDANGGFTVDSPYLGSGYKFWTEGHRPVGNDGEPFSDIDTGVGCIQTKLTPFHPANLLIKV